MKAILRLSVALCFFYSTHAQTKPSLVTKAPVDTFSRNIIAAVKKVSAAIANPKITASGLTRDLVITTDKQELIFTTPYNVIGSEKTYLKRTGTDRSAGITKWEWNAVIVSAPKGTMATVITDTDKKLDSILKTIPPVIEADPRHHIRYRYPISFINQDIFKKDSLSLVIEFTKPVLTTEKEALDSIMKIYKPMMPDLNNAAFVSNAMGNAMLQEDIAKATIENEFIPYIKEVANRDINAAWAVLMNCPDPVVKTLKESLTANQQQQITSMASEIVNAVYQHNLPKTEPVVPKLVLKPQISSSEQWCKDKIAKVKYKDGTIIQPKSGNSAFNFIVSFDCYKGYLLATLTQVPPRKTFFKTNDNVGYNRISYDYYPEDIIVSQYTATPYKCLICSVCKGSGVIYETQTRTKGGSWEQVNFNVFVHTPGRVVAEWEERKTCPQCMGSGVKSVK